MSEQTDTPTVNTLGYSEWSASNVYDDPLESRLKFGDYIREELIRADAYTPDIETGLRQGFTELLQEDGILAEDNSNAAEVEQRIADIQRGRTFDQLARSFQQSLATSEPDRQILSDYLSASSVESPSVEYTEELQPLLNNATEVVNKNRDQLLRTKVDSGELPMAKLANGQLIVGESAAQMDLVEALKASSEGGVGMGDAMAAQAQLSTPDGFNIPLYRIQKVAQASRLLAVERSENEDFDIQIDGLSTEAAESEYSFMDWVEKKASDVGRGIKNFFGYIMGQGEAIEKQEARREAIDEARGTNIKQMGAKYALKFDMRPEDMELAIEQMVLENAVNKEMFEFHDLDDDDIGKNLRVGGYGLPVMSMQAMVNKDVFDKTLAANPDLSEEVVNMLNKQRVGVLQSEFTRLDKFLSDSNVSDSWNTALVSGRSAGVEDYKILEGFIADEDNYNEFAERAAGIGMSFVNGVGQLFAAIPAVFGFDPAKDYLASVSQANADRRQLAAVFGEEFGFLQDAAETALPMLIDIAATTILAAGTAPLGGAGGVAYASLKAGGTATASMTAKGMVKAVTSSVFRKTGAKSAADQAEDLLAANLVKGSKEGAVDILNAYNSKLSAHLGNLPAIFLPAATRSGSATYGAVYNQLKQNPDVSPDEAHDRALGAMLMAGTFTGLLTSAFSTIGRGGMEDALLKGLSYKQMNRVGKSITGKLDGDLLSAAQIALKKTMKKYAFGGVKGIAKGVIDEGIEESIDEFVNGLITDAALHEDTPMLERLQQTFHAFALGGMMGGSVPLVQRGLRSLQPDVIRQREMSSFYDDVLEQMSTDLTESGAPITAEVVNAIVSDMRRKDARASVVPTAEEQAALIGRAEPEATEEGTQLPSGITPDPEMEALLGEKVNPDSVAKALSEVLAEDVPIAEGADPTTIEAKGNMLRQLELPLRESSSIENADHQAVRGLMQKRRALIEGAQLGSEMRAQVTPPAKRTFIDPARAEEAAAIEQNFRNTILAINEAEALYKKMEQQVAQSEVTGESSVRRALNKRVREGKAVSPEQAVELRGEVFKDRVLALKGLKIEKKVELEEVTQSPEEIASIDSIIESGFPHVVSIAKLKKLNVPVNQRTTTDSFLSAANDRISSEIKARFPKIPVTKPEGGIALDVAYGEGKVFLDRFGVGQFNNDPLTMLSLLETGAPIVVEPDQLNSPTLNPAFKFFRVGDNIVVSDIVVPESGGLVSALTPADRVLALQPNYTRLVGLVERVTAIRSEELSSPDELIQSPFSPTEKITRQDVLTRLENNESVAGFLIPNTGQLSPEFTESALIELRLRAQESLFNGDPISLPSLGREVADTYMTEQKARLKHMRESFATTVSVNSVSALETDPDFNAVSESEDTYTAFPENAPPPFSESGIADMLKEVQSNALAAIDADPSLRQSFVNLVQNEVFESSTTDFNRTSSKQLFGFTLQWMAQGNNRANASSLAFQKALREGQFEMGSPVREALQLMGLSSASVEGSPNTNPAYRAFLKDKLRPLKGGVTPSNAEVVSFHNYVRRSVGALMLRSQQRNLGKGYIQAVNKNGIAALGLKDGDSESIIEALRRIADVSDRAQKEYDSHLVSIARLLLGSPDFIRRIELSIDETNLNYAGKFDNLADGTPTISININGDNPRGVADTLLHELIHAYVTGVTRKPADLQTEQEVRAIDLLEGVITDIKSDFKKMSQEGTLFHLPTTIRQADFGIYKYHDTRIYDALSNVDEFVAHFLTSTDFQKFVKSILVTRNAPAEYSRFEQIIAAIRKFFRGASPEFDAAFSAVLDLSHSSVLAAGARRRSKRDLIGVEEFLNLPNKKSRTAKDFIADSVFPTDPATNNTAPKEPVTADAIVGKIAEDVSRSQEEAVRLSSGLQAATGVDVRAEQRGQQALERLILFVRNRVAPPEMRVDVDLNHPTMASVNSETGTMVINPIKLAALVKDLQNRNGGRPVSMRNQMNAVAVVINEEIAHAASVASLTRSEQQEIIDSMTFAEAEEAISNYGDEGNEAKRASLREGWQNGDRDAQVEVMEEYLRQHAQKVTRGFSTEEEIAFIRRNPNVLQYVIRYFKRFLKKLGYYRARRDISPQLRTAVDRVVNEVRALEAGFRHISNLKPFDPNNPESVIEQFRKQANMNKPIERADEPRETERVMVDSGITVQVPEDAGDVINAREWDKVGRQLGSNMGGVYEDENGKKHYFKQSKTPEHARNEVLATILYETVGADVLPIRLATGKNAAGEDVLGTASEWREDFTDFDPEDPAMRKLAYDDFAVHAWLANWDVVGLVYDNLMVDGEGNVVHVDTGGALKFRAQGEPKGGAWNEEGSEFATLRVMGQAGEVFGDMSTADLQNSANKLRKMTDEVIRSAVESVMGVGVDSTDMINTLIARRDNILNVAFNGDQFVDSGITVESPTDREPQEMISFADFDFEGGLPEELEYDRFEDGRFQGAPLRKFQAGMLSEGEKPSEDPLTEKDVENLEERLKKLTVEGAVGRFWYEDAAKKILEITNGDVVEAEKLIALLAIYSPQTGVQVNTYFAIRGYEQHANNVSREDYKVKTAVQDNKARAVLYDNKDWVGRKTDNFYKNIMFHIVQEATPEQLKAMRIDTAFLEDIQQPVTVDMWVYRALGYDTIGLTDKEGKGPFGFSEKMINRITYSLNQNLAEGEPRYEAHQVQAMIWTAIKARSEDKAVKKKTEAESIAAGDLVRRGQERIFTKRKVTKMVKGKKKEVMSDAPSERDHQRRWTENALAATGVDFVEASRSFDYFVNSMGLLATWEVIASTKTEVGERLAAMSIDEKRSFTEQAMRLIIDPTTGEDLLAKELGIALSTAKISMGGYQGGITPNVLSTLYPNKPKDVGGKETYDDDAIRAYARGLQYIFMQDAVPWARFVKHTKQDVFYKVSKRGTTSRGGARFETQEEAEKFAASENAKIDTGKVVKVEDGEGYQIQNKKGKPYKLRSKETKRMEETPVFVPTVTEDPDLTEQQRIDKADKEAKEAAESFRRDNLMHIVGGNNQSHGVRLTFAEDLTESKEQEIQDFLSATHPDLGFTKVGVNQIIIVNYKMDYMNMLPVLTDDTFTDKIIEQYEQEAELEEITTVGEYGYHDWKTDKAGEGILTLSPRFGPDVQTWIRGRRERFQRIAPQPEEGRLASGITARMGDEDYGFASEAMRRVFEPRRDRLRIRTDVEERDESPAIQLTGDSEEPSFLDVIKKAPQRQQEARKDVGNVPIRLRAIDREFFALEQKRKQAPTAEERVELSEKQRDLILEVATLKGYSPSLYHGTARKLSVQALFAKYGISHITADGDPVMNKGYSAQLVPDDLLDNIKEFADEKSFNHRYPFEVYRGATGEHYTPATGLMFFTPRDYSARSFATMKTDHMGSEDTSFYKGSEYYEPIVLPTFIKADKIFDPREDWEQVADILNRLKAEGRLGNLAYSPITPRGVSPADPVPFHLPPKAEIKRDDVAAQHSEDYYRMVNGKWDWWERPAVIDAVFDMGYDAILISEYASDKRVDPDSTFNIAVRDPSKVKTSHTKTYDKGGNIIPPSKRFDEGKDAHMFSGITTSFGQKEGDSLTGEQAKELKEIQEEYDSILNEYRGVLSSDPRIRNGSTNAKEAAQIKTILTQTEEVQQGYLYEFLGEEFEGFGFSPDLESFGDDAPDMSVPQMVADQITKRLQPLVDRAAELTGWSRRNMYHGTSVAKDKRPKFDTFDPSKSDFAGKFGLTFFSPKVLKAEEFIQMQETGVDGHAVIPVVAKDEMSVFDPRVNWEEFIDDMGVAFAREYFGPNAEYATDAEVLKDYRDTRSSYGDVGEVFSESILDKIKRGYWLYWEKPELVDIILSKYDGMLVTEVGGGQRMLPEYAGDDGLPKDEHMNLAIRNPNLVKSVAPITLDSKGEIVPLSDRFNPDSPKYIHSGVTTFGAASDLPSEFNSEGVDYSQFIEVLEMPFIEKGGFQNVKGTFMKLFKGETDPTVQRYVRQRDSFLRASDKVVDEYHTKYKAALKKDFPNSADIPWDTIQAATGTTDNIDPDPDNVLLDARNKVKDAAHAQYQSDLATEYAKHKQAEDAERVKIDAAESDPDKRQKLYSAAAKARKSKQESSKAALKATKDAAYEKAQKDYEEDKAKSFDAKKADMIKDRNEAFDSLRESAPNLFPVLLDLRRLTDELSAKAKDLFGVFSKKDLSVKFDNNMGLYVTRRYQMFSDTDYVERILTSEEDGARAVRDAAIDFMRDQYIKFEYDRFRKDGRTDAEAQAAAEAKYDSREEGSQSLGYKMVHDFLNSFDTETGAVDFASAFDLAGKPASLPARMSDSLKALTKNLEGRAEIPKPLADLMGANNVPEDSIDSLLYTLGTVSKIAAHQSFLNAMREQGQQGGWLMTSTQRNEALKKAKTKEEFDLINSMKPIVSSGADSGLNPLAGMYATKEVIEDIRPMFQQTVRQANDASSRAIHNVVTFAQKATGTAMAAKTLGSIGFYLRNMLSNVLFFGPAQGYFGAAKSLYSGNPHSGTGMSAAIATGRAFRGNSAQTSAYLRELEALGVFGDEVRSEIMIKLMRGEETFESLEGKLADLNKRAAKAKGAKALASIHNTAARLGSAMDSFYKIGYFEHELAVIEKAAEAEKGMPQKDRKYSLMSDMQKKQAAADIVSATAQSYSRAIPLVKKISGSGVGLVIAPFIRFTAEVPRIAVNTFTLARKEMKDSNPVIKSRGRRRMAGFGTVAVFSTAAPALLMRLLSGMGEDEDEAYRMSLPPYLRNHTFYYFKGDSAIAKAARKLSGGKEGDLTTFDLTYLNPFAVIADPFLRGIEHLVRGEPVTAAEKIITTAFLEPYLGDQILAGSIMDVKENRDARSGRPIFEESDPLWRKLGKQMLYVGREAYGPRTPLKVMEAFQAAGGEVEKFADSPFGIIASEFYPVRPRANDPADQFSRVVYQLRDEQRRVQARFNKLKQSKGMGEGSVRSVYKDVLESRMRINQRMSQALRGFNGLGVKNAELYSKLRAARYGDRRTKLLFAGFMENPVPTTDLVQSLMRTTQGQQRLKWLMNEQSKNPRFLRLDD